jgi:hypothetical protein
VITHFEYFSDSHTFLATAYGLQFLPVAGFGSSMQTGLFTDSRKNAFSNCNVELCFWARKKLLVKSVYILINAAAKTNKY